MLLYVLSFKEMFGWKAEVHKELSLSITHLLLSSLRLTKRPTRYYTTTNFKICVYYKKFSLPYLTNSIGL